MFAPVYSVSLILAPHPYSYLSKLANEFILGQEKFNLLTHQSKDEMVILSFPEFSVILDWAEVLLNFVFKKNSFQFFLYLTNACVYLITQECLFIRLLQPNIVFVIFNTLNLSKLFLTPGDLRRNSHSLDHSNLAPVLPFVAEKSP